MPRPLDKRRNKQRGTRFEYRVRDHLKSLGWTVFRSAGSRSPADLIALAQSYDNSLITLCVQCKAYEDPTLERAEFKGLLALRKMGALVLVISRLEGNHALQFFELSRRGYTLIDLNGEPEWL